MAPLISRVAQSFGLGSSLERKRRGGKGINYIAQQLYVFFKSPGGSAQPYTFPTQFQQAGSITEIVFGGVGTGGVGANGGFLVAGPGGGGGSVSLNYPLPAPLRTTDITQNGLTFNFPSTGGSNNTCNITGPGTELFYVRNGGPGATAANAANSAPPAASGGAGGSGGGRDGSGSPGNPGAAGGGGGGFGRGNNQSAGPGAAGGSSSPSSPVFPGWSVTYNVGQNGGLTGAQGEYGGNGGRGGGLSISQPTIPAPDLAYVNGNYGGGGGGGGASGQGGSRAGGDGFIIMYIDAMVPET